MKINILPDNSKKNRAPEPAPVFKPYYTGSSKTLAFLGNNLLYLISFLFPVVVLFTLMAVNGFAPFGDKNLFILDGSVYNLPHFATFVEQLHSGNFSFFMEGGVLGKEYFSTIVFYLTSPLHLLLCFFSQETAIVLLAVVTVLQIGFAGFAMTFYLTHRLQGYRYSKYDYSVLLFSFAFSLSGYFLVQYNDFMYLDCVILFPLLFLALEHLLYKDTYKYFYGLLAFCFFCNFYMAAIIFVLLFFYVLTRKKGDFTNSVAKCIKYLFTGIFAALTSAVTV
ncbi:MAG: YfhO family protein, partial [Firmicutes bacterium]|nr:YfhO family protein [Bacillota bacterium]